MIGVAALELGSRQVIAHVERRSIEFLLLFQGLFELLDHTGTSRMMRFAKSLAYRYDNGS